MEQIKGVQERQELEAGQSRSYQLEDRQARFQIVEASQARVLPLESNQREPDQCDHPPATSNIRGPHLALMPPGHQLFQGSEESGKKCEPRKERQDPTEHHHCEEQYVRLPKLLHMVIMVRPMDVVNMHLSNA